ncbi:MAG TPA: DNA repair protein RecN [Bryobacteraceae bacterium]|nr:DNA repair protein RecN [Bryobacteraceae bacterium]
MLLELHVENFAVVEKVRVHFGPGLNVLTGETGSGKSLVVDALALLFGGRASADHVRYGTERARVTGIFEMNTAAATILAEAGVEAEEEEIVLEREILSNGKSRAFAASRPVTAALLRQLAPALGDIHGQHDQQRLFDSFAQLDMLDSFAGCASLLAETARAFEQWSACKAELANLETSESERLRLLDLWTFQRDEIAAVRLKPGEDIELDAERRVLQNVGKLLESANAAYTALYDAPDSASAQLRSALRKIEDLLRYDESLAPVQETLTPARIAIEEASGTLRDYLGSLEADPDRLEQIEVRLSAIDKLRRKYGATADEILAFAADVQARLDGAESASSRRAELDRQLRDFGAAYTAVAAKLTSARKAAGIVLADRVAEELRDLAMGGSRFAVSLGDASWSAKGSDSATFLFSANAGEELKPLEKVASGGELSRTALALKTCVTAGPSARTLVFDEVDAGVGGTAAESVGRKLKAISAANQVLCVTHLAQIAGFADHHFSVEKHEVLGRTVADIQRLERDARTREIGRMLSGQRLTPEALRHAEQLLRLAES